MPPPDGLGSRPATILLDPIGGVSGDMFLAALLDAWPALVEPVLAAVRAALPAEYDVSLVERSTGALPAAGLAFTGNSGVPTGGHDAFRKRIGEARLAGSVQNHALEILTLLAEAEAAVHRVPIADAHFHELADWDTQADVVGAAAAIDLLDGASWHTRPLPLGAGTVRAAHGALPLPAPATAKLLEGFAFRADDGIPGERVTPTGAAILRYLSADAPPPAVLGKLVATGTGAGTRRFEGVPNILRVLGFAEGSSADQVLVVEFDVDDQSPEDLATGLDRLRGLAGVRDVTQFAGIGKKGRLVQSVRIMADPGQRETVVSAVFAETSTLGLRLRLEERAVLPRETVVVEEGGHSVRVKVAERPGGRSAKAEADDIAALAANAGERASLRHSAVRKALRPKEDSE
jgi:uncharacterized protein (TIGR00299 family) protein